ncbi:MAG: hypothetical protein AB7U83_02005 [Vicinamibacterales bacterium]
MTPASARALLTGVIDYAGLFPPAALPMQTAVAEYTAARAGSDAWLLGRFVVPAPRLAELAAARLAAPAPWQVSAIVGIGDLADVSAVHVFNDAASAHGARIDSVEARPATPDDVDWLADAFAEIAEIYVELTPGATLAPWLDRVAARGLRAKVRTGGMTPEAFPTPDVVAGFLAAVVERGVPFKATAGLHHAVRGTYRLTYAADSGDAPMFGYLNVLFATAALRAGHPLATARDLLAATASSSLVFADDAATWNGVSLPVATLEETRAHGLLSFGSCSFREPADELPHLTAELKLRPTPDR